MSTAPKVVVLGMITRFPVPGVVWQTLHYLLGFERLGYRAYYVEAHARTPTMFIQRPDQDATRRAVAYLDRLMARFDLGERWAFHALHDGDACYGLSEAALADLYRSAALIVNLSGGTEPRPEHLAAGPLVMVDTDPVELQSQLARSDPVAVDFTRAHDALFTFAENYGLAGCLLPDAPGFDFRPTRQPVIMDLWPRGGEEPAPDGLFTTIGNWRQARKIRLGGEAYSWSKHVEFAKFLDIPSRLGARFELTLGSISEEDAELLRAAGWRVRTRDLARNDLDLYRRYVSESLGEFTVAKDQNVRLRTGWFSDRSATYLATGRPVITQDTGFGAVLPTGDGLFAFTGVDDIEYALERIDGDYPRCSRAAAEIARSYFAHDVVLGDMLQHLGLERVAGRARPGAVRSPPADGPAAASLNRAFRPFPADMPVLPRSKRPMVLEAATVAEANGAFAASSPVSWVQPGPPSGIGRRPSVVVVSYDNAVFTRLCVESLIANSRHPDLEVVVVDNASTDETLAYLHEVAWARPEVRVLEQDRNLGFAAACNIGIAASTGEIVVVMNNDVIVPPGWLAGLARHLEDPSIGMVGPVTNEAPNEARIESTYRTYGEFEAFADARATDHAGRAIELSMLTMFCVALPRSVLDVIGPLDESFGMGMFEDDDYAMRLRRAGYRIVCAEDVAVHHFGEASLGKLVGSGEHSALFSANRSKFEEKWGVEWEPHRRRPTDGHDASLQQLRRLVTSHVAPRSTVAVISRGDPSLVELGDQRAWHFPASPSGGYSGSHPADDDEANRTLEDVRERGAEFLLVPRTSAWWLEHYRGFAARLCATYRMAAEDEAGLLFDLRDARSHDALGPTTRGKP